MRTAWPDRMGTETAPAGGARPAPAPRVDWARLGAWVAVVALAVAFWVAVALVIALLV